MKKYQNDPRPIPLRWRCKCSKCSKTLNRGELALYWPSDRKILCYPCGEKDYNAFLSSASDEEVYQGTGNPYYG